MAQRSAVSSVSLLCPSRGASAPALLACVNSAGPPPPPPPPIKAAQGPGRRAPPAAGHRTPRRQGGRRVQDTHRPGGLRGLVQVCAAQPPACGPGGAGLQARRVRCLLAPVLHGPLPPDRPWANPPACPWCRARPELMVAAAAWAKGSRFSEVGAGRALHRRWVPTQQPAGPQASDVCSDARFSSSSSSEGSTRAFLTTPR